MRTINVGMGVGMALAIAFVCAAPAVADSVTVARFVDPADNHTTPLFAVDLTNDRITSLWTDEMLGLDLEVPVAVAPPYVYTDAFFTLTDPAGNDGIEYTVDGFYGETGAGILRFYADGVDPETADPLVRFDFEKAYLTPTGVGAESLFMGQGNVSVGGGVVPAGMTQVSFAFSFANQSLDQFPDGDGFTTTASFTSSAIPEPSIAALLGIGFLGLVRRRRAI